MDTRPIPSTGEPLPIIGCGTWQAFDVAPDGAQVATLTRVVGTLLDAGGLMIDSSPMYGRAEAVVGKCLTAPGTRARAFVATKVWTRGQQAGIEEMRRSLARLGTPRLDLMQIHNLLDWRTHLDTLRDWKAEGTHPLSGGHALHRQRSRRAGGGDAQRATRFRAGELFARGTRGRARIAAARCRPRHRRHRQPPVRRGALVRRLRAQPVPEWAAEYGCRTWSQLLLKYVLAHPAVTCVIPGTGNPDHMAEDCAAGAGPFIDPRRLAGMVL